MKISSEAVIQNTLKGINDNHGRLHPQLSQTGAVMPYHLFGCNQNEVKENYYTISLLFGWNNPCWAGVEAESELEAESIFSDWSRSRSRLKFVDSAALIIIVFPIYVLF